MSIQYKAIIIQEEDCRFFVQFPTINEAFTEAKTLSDSLINAEVLIVVGLILVVFWYILIT